jgi:hypothetical protein
VLQLVDAGLSRASLVVIKCRLLHRAATSLTDGENKDAPEGDGKAALALWWRQITAAARCDGASAAGGRAKAGSAGIGLPRWRHMAEMRREA